MSITPDEIDIARKHGPFIRVTVVDIKGSTPRETGASMFVWPDRIAGTIGGGRLEYDAIRTARATTRPHLERVALGPSIGQCCGGSVVLAYEPDSVFQGLAPGWYARPMDAHPGDMPLGVRRALQRLRDRGDIPAMLIDGWILEQVAPAPNDLWIWGAGHVGRALASVMAPFTDLRISWADMAQDRFPDPLPDRTTSLIADNPADLVSLAPPKAHHLIMTYSHALDLELCHRLLNHGFATCGLIGSATKWARFRHRLADLGHMDAQISRIACPIGDPSLGKAPQAIAISVAAALLKDLSAGQSATADTRHLTRTAMTEERIG